MIKKNLCLLAFIASVFFILPQAQAYWVWSPESGKFINPEKAVQDSAEEQFDYAMQFYKEQNLDEAAKQFQNLLKKYPSSSIAPEAQYRLGTIYEEKQDYLKAFEAYKVLVETYPQSERFPEVIEREFEIGNLFYAGRKAKLMGLEILPALPRAVEVFKHITTAAPYGDFGPKAQFHLGLSYKKMGHFDEAVETFQGLIDQYPQSEFVSQARFQITESSFLKSTAQFRDQKALDDASQEVDRLLAHKPGAMEMEKAEKIKQVIDEKNAEKNYRIGMYYEKDKYLESAMIYYRDVAARYPNTQWGKKAQERMRALESPTSFMSEHQKELESQEKTLEDELKGLSDSDGERKKSLKEQLEKVRDRRKELSSDKEDILESRSQDIQRRKHELKEKFKTLEKKKKAAGPNPTEDFQKAMDRWHASLMEEQDALEREESQLKEWREELGVSGDQDWLDYIPFLGESPSELEKVRQIEAKKLYKIAQEKKKLLEIKEKLYEEQKLLEIKAEPRADEVNSLQMPAVTGKMNLQDLKNKADLTEKGIQDLESLIEQKKQAYEGVYGKSTWETLAEVPVDIVAVSGQAVAKSVSFLNPFDSGEKLASMDLQELLESRMHTREKIHAQKEIVETLGRAFNSELILKEQEQLIRSLKKSGETDPMTLRKQIKTVEKEIRSHYEAVQDGHKIKQQLLDELEDTLRTSGKSDRPAVKLGKMITGPIRGTGAFVKGFIVGMPNRDETLTQSASEIQGTGVDSETAGVLKQRIEEESLLVEAHYAEVTRLKKKLEVLNAKASLAGGYRFRSAFVDVPYHFIEEAVKSAQRIVPQKSRDKFLAEQLEKESDELKKIQKQLQTLETEIDRRGVGEMPMAGEEPLVEAESGEKIPEESVMKNEIEQLLKQLKWKKELHSRETEVYQSALRGQDEKKDASEDTSFVELSVPQLSPKASGKKTKRMHKKLNRIISEEIELEKEEKTILAKRIAYIDKTIPELTSRMRIQDLTTEKERLAARTAEIQSRLDFLTSEMERFQNT